MSARPDDKLGRGDNEVRAAMMAVAHGKLRILTRC